MTIDLFHCPICHKRYDNDAQTPKVIAKCGSTICLECLTKIFKKNKGSPTCPLHLENKEPLLWTKVEKFASNLLILQQLPESNPKISSCSQHKSKLKFVCFQDEVFLCKYCIQSNDHKTHNIYHINDIKGLAIAKKQQLETILSDLAPSLKQATLKQTVIEKFDFLKKFIVWKQIKLLEETNKQISQAKSELGFKKQGIEDQIKIQINHLSEKVLSTNFFDILNCDIPLDFPLKSQAEQTVQSDQQISKINLLRKDIQKALIIFDLLHCEEHKSENRKKEDHIEPPPPKEEEKSCWYPHPNKKELIIKIDSNNIYTTLTPFFKSSNNSFQSQIFEMFMSILRTLDSSEKLVLNFSKMKPNEDYLLIIQDLWKVFGSRVLELAVDLSNPGLTDDNLINYFSSPFWTGFQFRAGEKILSLNIDLSGCLLLSHSLKNFPDYLPKMPNLKKLAINLSRTKADNVLVDALMNKEIISNNSLEFFSLDFSLSSVNEEGLNALIKNLHPLMYQLKALEINACQIESEVPKMTSYSLKELSKMKPLQAFAFHLGGCKKLENIKEQLFIDPHTNFANLTQIIIGLSQTREVNEFVQNSNLNLLSSCGKNLKILHLELSKSDIEIPFLSSFFYKPIFAKGLNELSLNIEGTMIGNEFMQDLKAEFLPDLQKIEKLTFRMIEFKIGPKHQKKLFNHLTNLSKSDLRSLKKIDVKYEDKIKESESQEINETILNKQQHLLDKINSKKSKKKGNRKVPQSERLNIKFDE